MTNTHVLVYADAEQTATATAAHVISKLAEAQHARGFASVVLTGGGIGIATLREVATSPARDAVDWSALDVWWGDERFVPSDDPERNELQAREALLNHMPVSEKRIHPIPASDHCPDAETAASRYADALAAAAPSGRALPPLDVVLLGVGPDGHVASLFGEHPAVYDDAPVAAVHGAPKPPPTRITLTFPTIRSADEVWLIAAGQAKAAAIGLAVSGAGETQVPAAGARGGIRTLWLLDRDAATHVPPELRNAF